MPLDSERHATPDPTPTMATTPTPTPASPGPIHREWIASEFSKGLHAEHEMASEARERASAPPEAALGVLYTQIADADERHRAVIETVAVRYGHTPARSSGGGIGETLSRLKDKVAGIGTTPQERIGHDLTAKANAIHWYAAWVHAFEEIGDGESARELAAVLTEEKSHHDALQEVLKRLVARGARGGEEAVSGK